MTTNTERVRTPFGAETTASQVMAGVNLRGHRAIITGASSGIGVETAHARAQAGAEVTPGDRPAAIRSGRLPDLSYRA